MLPDRYSKPEDSDPTYTLDCDEPHLELMYELTHHQNILERALAHAPTLSALARAEHSLAGDAYVQLAKKWPHAGDSTTFPHA